MPDKHSVLSPSSSSRWYHCQRSARLCEQVPDEGSIYSAEGTDAHALCEYLLKKAMGKPCADPRPQMQFYSPEMEEAARGYVQYVLEKAEAMRQSGTEPLVFAEQLLDLRAYVPQSAGTADCVVIGGDRALIVDFKYGFRPVPAESLQLRLYALGVCEMFSSIYEIRTVSTAIYQPRISAVSEAAYTIEELYTWAREELAPRARLAFDGAGNFEVGEWCHFCKVRRNCRALADHELELARYEFRDPALLSDDEIAEVLLRADALVSWANHVKEFALSPDSRSWKAGLSAAIPTTRKWLPGWKPPARIPMSTGCWASRPWKSCSAKRNFPICCPTWLAARKANRPWFPFPTNVPK